MKAAVRAALRSALRRYSGVLPLQALIQGCEEAVRLEDLTLFSTSPGELPPCCAEVTAAYMKSLLYNGASLALCFSSPRCWGQHD